MIEALNGRPAGDILSRVVRVTLSGRQFALPVRSIRFNREWKASLDARTAGSVDALVEAGNDWEKVLAQLEQNIEPFIDLLASYAPDVLSRDQIEDLEPDPSMDVINACREVWLAATPLVARSVETLTQMLSATDGSEPTSLPPPSTAGFQRRSKSDSPTSSSSPTSTLPPTDSRSGAARSSAPSSTPSVRAPSTPTTNGHSADGKAKPRSARAAGRSAAKRSRRP